MTAPHRLLLAFLVPIVLASPPLPWATSTVAAQQGELPTIRLIATGGTIANRPGGRLTANQLVGSIPALNRYVIAESEQFANVASGALTLQQWMELSLRINTLFDERNDLDGVVVTSGTDTLEEIAYFLHLTVRSDRPVVVVGAMRPPQSLGYDGAANLFQAFRAAAEPEARGQGVIVVLNNEIHSAREVTKTDARLLDAFSSRGYGTLGRVDTDQVVFHRRVDRRHTFASEFDIRTVRSLPRVDVLLAYQDAPGDLVHAAVEAGAKGLVLAGLGAGGASQAQRDAMRAVIEDGTPVVVTTRTGGGRVAPRRLGPNLDETRSDENALVARIAGEDLSAVKARILLMLGLTQTGDSDELRRMFSEY